MTINDLTQSIGIYCDKSNGRYFLYDGQGSYDLINEYSEDGGFDTLEDVIDRVSGIWYDWIYEDLVDEFGCEEDFNGDFNSMLDWMDENVGIIYPETYNWYSEVIESILNPSSIEDDAMEQDD